MTLTAPAQHTGSEAENRRRSWLRRAPCLTALLTLGAALRILAVVTYFGGVDFHYDSYSYLNNAARLQPDLWHPIVYPFILRGLSLVAPASAIAVVQGLVGLATGAVVYSLGRRLGLSDRWAALAAAPVVLDAWQVAVEQTVMSEPIFELLLASGLLLLLGRPSLSWWRISLGSTALSLACLTRTAALPVMALTLLFLLVRRVPVKKLLVAATCSAIPLLAYAAAFSNTYGPFELSGLNGRTIYGETATFARCSLLPPTPTNTVLCPRVPLSQRAGSNQYTWDVSSPLNRLPLSSRTRVGRVLELNQRAAAFGKQVIRNQPLGYARYVADTTGRYFTVGRRARLQDFPQVAWQFMGVRRPAPVYDVTLAARGFDRTTPPDERPMLMTARLLRAYQRVGYTPGPLLALAGLAGLANAVYRRRRKLEAGLLGVSGLAVLIMPSLAAGFDYRYLLPAMLLLPLSGALAGSAWWNSRSARSSATRRRAVAATSLVVLPALLAANVLNAGMVPTSRQHATRTAAAGQEVSLHQGLSVQIGEPRVRFARCRHASATTLRWWWAFDVPVHLRSAAGPHLLQGASLSIQHGRLPEQQAMTFRRSRGSRDVPVVVSRAAGDASGTAGFLVPYASGTIRWSDSVGAGVAQWPLRVRAQGLPPAGSACYLPAQVLTPVES